MTELGNRLKEVRLAKQLSLDDLQSMTKIQKRYLVGIEEGNYSGIPGNFYVRAFIKQYAEALDLNPEELFETYKNEIPAVFNDALPDQLSRVKSRKITDGHSKVFDILPKVLIGVFLIGAASLIYLFVVNHKGSNTNESINRDNPPTKIVKSENLEKANDEKNNQKKNDDTAAKGGTNAESQTPPQEITPQQELSVVASSGYKTTYMVKNADKFQVKLVSQGNTWVSIKDASGKSYYQGFLNVSDTPSKTFDLTSGTGAQLVVGNAAVTDIYVNDQKLDYAIEPAKVVRQNITIQFVPMNK